MRDEMALAEHGYPSGDKRLKSEPFNSIYCDGWNAALENAPEVLVLVELAEDYLHRVKYWWGNENELYSKIDGVLTRYRESVNTKRRER